MNRDGAADPPSPAGALCGIWIDEAGPVRVARESGPGPRRVETLPFTPFAWLAGPFDAPAAGVTLEPLKGGGVFRWLAGGGNVPEFDGYLRGVKPGAAWDALKPWEHAALLQHRLRLFSGMGFRHLRRARLDIETACHEPGGFSNAGHPDDRLLAIGLECGGRCDLLEAAAATDEAERALLEELNTWLAGTDPDVIEGHNIFRFDLDYLRQRAKRLKVPCAWGRCGTRAVFRKSRFKVAERWIEFPRCDLPGRAVIDTWLLLQAYDAGIRELPSYGLKEAALHFGISPPGGRTRIEGPRIQEVFLRDRGTFRAYLADDLRETRGLADLLLPSVFEQTRIFPITLQEAALRGVTARIDLLFLEEYYHARQALPAPREVAPFEGGYTRSFHTGVFRDVLHFDVASLYPSLLLGIGRNPEGDSLGVFLPLLARLRSQRLQYKELARNAPDPADRQEYAARQAGFKILINSFYGYLGFSGARFGDGALAADVTRRGRGLIQALIAAFEAEGAQILEADTDGIYLACGKHHDAPGLLLEVARPVLPPGVELEFDGRYEAMFCYKSKNYALREGDRIIVRGSALRSRGIEPFLRELTELLLRQLLGLEKEGPLGRVRRLREEIAAGRLPVERLAKSESLSQNPEAYERAAAAGEVPRRASAEAALLMKPRPRMGDRVSYFITTGAQARAADWTRALPVAMHDPGKAPYDPGYYLGKLDDWVERYRPFIEGAGSEGPQRELF